MPALSELRPQPHVHVYETFLRKSRSSFQVPMWRPIKNSAPCVTRRNMIAKCSSLLSTQALFEKQVSLPEGFRESSTFKTVSLILLAFVMAARPLGTSENFRPRDGERNPRDCIADVASLHLSYPLSNTNLGYGRLLLSNLLSGVKESNLGRPVQMLQFGQCESVLLFLDYSS